MPSVCRSISYIPSLAPDPRFEAFLFAEIKRRSGSRLELADEESTDCI